MIKRLATPGRARFRILLAAAFGLAVFAGPSLAQETSTAISDPNYQDKVYLRNGDRITGNIKELDRGKLRLKTRTMDDVFISWEEIESIDSTKYLRVERTDGSYVYGRPNPTEEEGGLEITSLTETVELTVDEIVAARTLKVNDRWWNRLEGAFQAGIDYKKATDILTVNVASNARLREEQYEIGAGFDWNQTTRTQNNDSFRANLNTDYTRLLRDRWFWRGAGAYERNDEIGLNGRILTTISGGRYLIKTNRRRWDVTLGLAGNFERRNTGERVKSLEAAIHTTFDLFIYKIPRQRLMASISAYPSLTESDRVRADTRLTLRNELVQDLFWDLQFYSNYDSKSGNEAESIDYGIVTSIGYSF